MAQVRLNCLLMGKTGHGKSLTGNNLLGRRVFRVSSCVESVTKDVQQGFAKFGNCILKIVDGPGLQDTAMNCAEDKETVAAQMAQALAMCDGGVDAFLYVHKYGSRMTDEERGALEALKKIFGAKFFSHLIVVVTMGDLFRIDMEEDDNGDITFLDWCRKQSGTLRQLFDDCGERFILFNNTERNENAMNQQRKEMIELVSQVQRINGRYTSHNFRDSKALRDRYIIEQKVPLLNELILEKCALLMNALAAYMNNPNALFKFKIIEEIAATKKTIRDEDKGTDLLKPLLALVERIEENLDNIDKLYKLTEELDDIRMTKYLWAKYGLFITSAGFRAALVTFFLPTVSLIFLASTCLTNAAIGIKCAYCSFKESKLEKELNATRAKLKKAGLTGNPT
ncbi:hypothetical protein BsWGS_26165 [Bradybaena similaris]